MTTPASDPGPSTALWNQAETLVAVATAGQRTDLADRIRTGLRRARSPQLSIGVVGEYKQGKSSLVNALVGAPVAPVDDDLATSAVTVVRRGPAVRVEVFTRQPGETVGTVGTLVPPADLAGWVTERGNPDNRRLVDHVLVDLPTSPLGDGIALVDSPGVGGLSSAHTATTLGWLPFADGVVFVTDACAELSRPQLDLLKRLTELTPHVLIVQTKTDLTPHAARLRDLDRTHLAAEGLAIPILPSSAILHEVGRRRSDAALIDDSGILQVRAAIADLLGGPSRTEAAAALRGTVLAVLTELTHVVEAERELLSDRSGIDAAVADLEQTRARLEHLRGPGARWQVLLSDRWAELTGRALHQLRDRLRELPAEAAERLAAATTTKKWEAVVSGIQAALVTAVSDTFLAALDGANTVHLEIRQFLRDEEQVDQPLVIGDFDTTALFSASTNPSQGGLRRAGQGVNAVLDLLKSSSSNMLWTSFLGTAIPAAGLAMVLANPFVIGGVAIVATSKAVLDSRKRKVDARRQQVRQRVQRLVDDVLFHGSHELTSLLRQGHALVRDDLLGRFGQLQRSTADLLTGAEAARQADENERAARLQALTVQRQSLVLIGRALDSDPLPISLPSAPFHDQQETSDD